MASVETVVTVKVENAEGEQMELSITHGSAVELRDALIASIGRPRIPRGPHAQKAERQGKRKREKFAAVGAAAE